MGYNIDIDEKAKDFILSKGWDQQYGARPLRRAIQRYIEDDLADEIIKAVILPGDTIQITTSEEGGEHVVFDLIKGEKSMEIEKATQGLLGTPASEATSEDSDTSADGPVTT